MSGYVLDLRRGEQVPITAENLGEIQAGLQEGSLSLPPTITVVDPETRGAYDIETEQDPRFVQKMLEGSSRFRFATQAEIDDLADREEYGNRGLEAFGAGAVRGLTLGASDFLLQAAGVPRETLEGIQRQNPTASGAGELTGIIAPAIATGGEALLARGAQTGIRGSARTAISSTPMGVATRTGLSLGRATEQAVGRTAAEGFGARTLARASGIAAQGAVEGLAMGAGDVVSDYALGNPQLTAESAVAHTMESMFTGALAGAGLSLGGSAIGKLGELTVRNGSVTDRARMAVKRLFNRTTGQVLDDAAADTVIRTAEVSKLKEIAAAAVEKGAKLHGVTDEMATFAKQLVTDSELARRATRSAEVIEEAVPKIKASVDKLQDLDARFYDATHAGLKREIFDQAIQHPMPAEGKVFAATFLEKIKDFSDTITANPAMWGKSHKAAMQIAREMGRFYKGFKSALIPEDAAALEAAMTREGTVDQMVKLDVLKMRLGELRKAANANLRNKVEGLYAEVQSHLMDESIYGTAALAQRDINEATSRLVETSKLFKRSFLGDVHERHPSRPWDTHRQFDIEKTAKWLNHDTGTLRGKSRDDLFDAHLSALQDTLSALNKYYDFDEASKVLIEKELRQATKEAREAMGKVRKTIGARNQFEALQQATKSSLFSALAGNSPGPFSSGVMGGFLGGPLGGAGAALLGLTTNAAKNVPEIAARLGSMGLPNATVRLATATEETASVIERTVNKFGKIKKTIQPSFTAARLYATQQLTPVYLERVQRVIELSDDPQALDEAASAASIGMEEVAPDTAIAAKEAYKSGVYYLQSQIPANSIPDPTVVGDTVSPASHMDMARFLTQMAAVEAPIAIIEKVGNKTASPTEVEALKAVYPSLYAQLVEGFSLRIERGEMNEKDKQDIGTMLGIKVRRDVPVVIEQSETTTETNAQGSTSYNRREVTLHDNDKPTHQNIFDL